MKLKIIVLLSFFIFQNVSAQTIILNDCWLKDILEKDKYAKTRDVLIDLQRKKLTFQGVDKKDMPYMLQDDFEIEAISTGFVKGKTFRVAPNGITTTKYTFDLLNAKYTTTLSLFQSKEMGHTKDSNEDVSTNLIICSGLNGKLVGVSKNQNQIQKKKKKSDSGAKSLLEKLLKKN